MNSAISFLLSSKLPVQMRTGAQCVWDPVSFEFWAHFATHRVISKEPHDESNGGEHSIEDESEQDPGIYPA